MDSNKLSTSASLQKIGSDESFEMLQQAPRLEFEGSLSMAVHQLENLVTHCRKHVSASTAATKCLEQIRRFDAFIEQLSDLGSVCAPLLDAAHLYDFRDVPHNGYRSLLAITGKCLEKVIAHSSKPRHSDFAELNEYVTYLLELKKVALLMADIQQINAQPRPSPTHAGTNASRTNTQQNTPSLSAASAAQQQRETTENIEAVDSPKTPLSNSEGIPRVVTQHAQPQRPTDLLHARHSKYAQHNLFPDVNFEQVWANASAEEQRSGVLRDPHAIMSAQDRADCEQLFRRAELINFELFYGRACGFYYCRSARDTLNFILSVMAGYASSYNKRVPSSVATPSTSGSASSHAASSNVSLLNAALSTITSLRKPEHRARRIVDLTLSSNIHFLKSFWNLTEHPVLERLKKLNLSANRVKFDFYISTRPPPLLPPPHPPLQCPHLSASSSPGSIASLCSSSSTQNVCCQAGESPMMTQVRVTKRKRRVSSGSHSNLAVSRPSISMKQLLERSDADQPVDNNNTATSVTVNKAEAAVSSSSACSSPVSGPPPPPHSLPNSISVGGVSGAPFAAAAPDSHSLPSPSSLAPSATASPQHHHHHHYYATNHHHPATNHEQPLLQLKVPMQNGGTKIVFPPKGISGRGVRLRLISKYFLQGHEWTLNAESAPTLSPHHSYQQQHSAAGQSQSPQHQQQSQPHLPSASSPGGAQESGASGSGGGSLIRDLSSKFPWTKRSTARPSTNMLVFHVHGGGFVAHSPDSHDHYMQWWARDLKCPLLSVDYRHAPAFPFPHALNECFWAYCWALANPDKLGLDVSACASEPRLLRVVLLGDSAGANLVIALCVRLIQEGVRLPHHVVPVYPVGLIQFWPSPSRILAIADPLLPIGIMHRIILAYSGIDEESLSGGNNSIAESADDKQSVDATTNRARTAGEKRSNESNNDGASAQDTPRRINLTQLRKAEIPMDICMSPYLAPKSILKHFPPVSIFAAEFDPLLDESVQLAKRFDEAGVHIELDVMKSLPHGFLGFSHHSAECKAAHNKITERIKFVFEH